MPRFTLIKHKSFDEDSEVTVDFETELLDSAYESINDFLRGAGFEMPEENNDYPPLHVV